MNHRPLNEIAAEIRSDWKNLNQVAKPYVDVMAALRNIREPYYYDSAVEAVALGTAGTRKGPVARRVKIELKGILAMHEGEVSRQRKIAN